MAQHDRLATLVKRATVGRGLPLAHGFTSFDRQPSALGIGQAQPAPSELMLERPVLFQQVLDHLLLMLVGPASEDDGGDVEGL